MFNRLITRLFLLDQTPKEHYSALKRNIIAVMLLITIVPLATMLVINYFQYRSHLRSQIIAPLYAMAEKTRHSFELFLNQRLATIRFISTTYSYQDLNDEQKIKKILISLKKEWQGFVDIGLIDSEGKLVSYAGPYSLVGKNYSDQLSFKETQIKGKYISDVFLGHRKFPHIIIAVQHLTDSGQSWIIRATIDTDFFNGLISSMGLPRLTDSFLINQEGILQTDSLYYGNTLEKWPLKLPRATSRPGSAEQSDNQNRNVIIVSSEFSITDYVLVIVQPQSVALKSWHVLQTEMIVIFLISLTIILVAILKMADVMVKRIKTSDENREAALAELQHAQKLSSIGRLAAGVAHEINNPLAIINEKAGLMGDLIELSANFDKKEKFSDLAKGIINSVSRCKKITHRLLGFSKRIQVHIEPININSVISEVLDFLEKDILYRKIDIVVDFSENLSLIQSDHGQLQQILINLLTNAFAAVDDFGRVDIHSKNIEDDGVRILIEDNGCGMPADVIKNIFDPFFSTKKEKGTGLGLSITYGIIKKLGGKISVDSQLKKGSVFIIDLPAKPNNQE
ncbi:MAG: ATP-binding protein [Desulfobacula sp.]|nr:ATP-binding protein [Desulfobacula sp.]